MQAVSDHDPWKTRWDLLRDIIEATPLTRRQILETLVVQYRQPVICYLRRRGHSLHDAEDLAQEFFCCILKSNLFSRADETKGRFRSYLLGALARFVAKQFRTQNTQSRQPSQPVTTIAGGDNVIDYARFTSPEDAFHHALVAELLETAIGECRRHFLFSSDSGKQKYWAVFEDRVLNPIFEGVPSLTLQQISVRHDIPVGSLSNILVTVKRRMRRAILDAIGLHASSKKQASEELQQLIELMGQ